jgi:hypothetical protein
MRMCPRRLKSAGVITLTLLLIACGSTSSSGPSSPSTPTTATTLTDLTGTWASQSGSWQWELTQNGSSVTGTSSFSAGVPAFGLGQYAGSGVVSGTFSNNTFTVTDKADTVSLPNCANDVATGVLTLSGTSLAGQMHETITCDGRTLGPVSETIKFTKR